MTDDSPSGLDHVIFHFLSNLPQTIRTDILLFVVMYTGCATAMEIERNLQQDYLKLMREFLFKQNSGIDAIGAILRTVGVLDFIIPRACEASKQTGTIASELAAKYPQAQKILLGAPLRQRHFDQALADWQGLRATSVTARTLRNFEDSRLN